MSDTKVHDVTDSDESPNTAHVNLGISLEHRNYLIQRHGTVELEPIPSADDADPYNWPVSKKTINLILVAFHAMIGTFGASAIIPAYADIAADLGTTIQNVSYLTSLQIVILGAAPLFWKPLSNRYGRRPIFIISLIGSLFCNIGCAKSPTYASTAACRALVALFICPPGALGSAVVAESFFKHERARYMGVWTLMVTLGVPLAPFIFGFVTERVGYRWIYWILAIINGIQLVLYIFFGPETRYIESSTEDSEKKSSSRFSQYLSFRRIDAEPFNAYEFIKPLTMVSRISVALPAAAYAMVFLFSSVMGTVEIPQLLQEKFELDAQGLGLQFLGLIIGSVLGEQVGGPLSDVWMNRRARRLKERPAPEYRLWLSYPGFILTIVGIVVFLVQVERSPAGSWNITPIVGVAIAAFGNQLITTVLTTYAIDRNHSEAASVGVFISFVRQTWGFIGPFWFTSMFDNVGIANSAWVATIMLVAGSIIPTLIVQWRGGKLTAA
ncbi:putative MFS multidrug transporter [Xylariales sp. PMI_506]|nr:putative MFS multidrug transporter [Xylariales sp. PMI_506]